MKFQAFPIRTKWSAGEMSGPVVGKKLLETLDQLKRLSPAMNNWLFITPPNAEVTTLDEARPSFTTFVERNISTDEDYTPQPADGYQFLIVGAEIPRDHLTPQSVDLTLKVGSNFRNEIDLEIGLSDQPLDFSLITYPIYRGALEALVSAWPCPWALAYTFSQEDQPIEPDVDIGGEPRAPFGGAWIAYLSPPLAAGLAPPAEIIAERTPGGGRILSAAAERIDESNPDHMRRSAILTAIMTERVGLAPGSWPIEATLPPRVGEY
jgi:hypothetical protein